MVVGGVAAVGVVWVVVVADVADDVDDVDCCCWLVGWLVVGGGVDVVVVGLLLFVV